MKCHTCGTAEGNVRFMCDEQDGEEYCGECFDFHPCGRGEHGEGCSTMMVSDEPDAEA
jgi:hypothetical protein